MVVIKFHYDVQAVAIVEYVKVWGKLRDLEKNINDIVAIVEYVKVRGHVHGLSS